MWYERLPHLNAFLNALSFVLLTLGYAAIRRKDAALHARLMLSAFATSVVFLASYIVYHLNVLHRPFGGTGWLRAVYLTILFSHIVLAALVPPLASVTLYFALRGRFARHRRIARWTFPIWVYVSITGVVVYLFLYVLDSGASV